MAVVELIMPKMGESIIEATIINWVKKEGDQVEEDETVLEVATDKVDSEVPSPVSGTITKLLFDVDDVVAVGKAIALIETGAPASTQTAPVEEVEIPAVESEPKVEVKPVPSEPVQHTAPIVVVEKPVSGRYYSPLIRNIAKTEGISLQELESIHATGPNGRLIKEDIFAYIERRRSYKLSEMNHPSTGSHTIKDTVIAPTTSQKEKAYTSSSSEHNPADFENQNVDIIEMDRMRRLISGHMIKSQNTSATVSSFVEADVTHMVHWRNRIKEDFKAKYGERLTFSPLFLEAVVKALKDFPKINASISGDNLVIKHDLNIGVATALPNGNLIVPVIKNCEDLNLKGMAKRLNDITARARVNKLKPEEIKDGTFTISNIGTFGNLMGTPIINQPELAILALGAIKKKPVIMETEHGDIIAIRHMMFLSLSFDHRVVDGYLGGTFLKRIADYIEKFDSNRDF